jgi:hypothetical protein
MMLKKGELVEIILIWEYHLPTKVEEAGMVVERRDEGRKAGSSYL